MGTQDSKVGEIRKLVAKWSELEFDKKDYQQKIAQICRDLQKVSTAEDIFFENSGQIDAHSAAHIGVELVGIAVEGLHKMDEFLWELHTIMDYCSSVVNQAKKEWGQS